jgi:transposase
VRLFFEVFLAPAEWARGVHQQDQRLVRRVEVEADHVLHFLRERRVEELLGRHGLLWEAVRPLLEVREKVRREIASLYRKLLTLARDDVDSRRSMTVPSIGPITALTFHSAIDEPARFQRSRSVGAYVIYGEGPLRRRPGKSTAM